MFLNPHNPPRGFQRLPLSTEALAKRGPERRRCLSVDLGKMEDYTAIAIIEENRVEANAIIRRWLQQRADPTRCGDDLLDLARPDKLPKLPDAILEVVYIERVPLQTPYPMIERRLLMMREQRPELQKASLVVDQTGVGTASVDYMRRAGLGPTGIVITGGNVITKRDDGGLNVPKKELASTIAVLLETGKLKYAAHLPFGQVLEGEMLNFKVKISKAGNEQTESWREKDHDDLVLCVAMGCWHLRVMGWVFDPAYWEAMTVISQMNEGQ